MKDESDAQRKRSGWRGLVGYRTSAWREGYGEVEMTVGPQHMNSIGMVHGGVYATLLDVALGHAVSFCTQPGNARYSSTVSLTTSYLKGVRSGVLRATGQIEGVSGRLVTGTGEVRSETGELLAAAQASFLYFPGSEKLEGVPRR